LQAKSPHVEKNHLPNYTKSRGARLLLRNTKGHQIHCNHYQAVDEKIFLEWSARLGKRRKADQNKIFMVVATLRGTS